MSRPRTSPWRRSLLPLIALVMSSVALGTPSLRGVGLAAAFLILGSGIATKSLLGFLGVLLDTFVWLLPWGFLVCFLALIALAAGGFTTCLRWLASSCVALLAIGSSVVVTTLTAASFSPGQLWFFLPAAISASLSIWLAAREWPRPRLQPQE